MAGSASGKAYSLPKPRRCCGDTSPKGTSLRNEERSRLGINVCVRVWPSLVKNQLMNSLAALGWGALANAEMQQPEPVARSTPAFLTRKRALIGKPLRARATYSSVPVATNCSGKRPLTSQVSRMRRSSLKVTPVLSHVASYPFGAAVRLEIAIDHLANAGRVAHALAGDFAFPLRIEDVGLFDERGDFRFFDFSVLYQISYWSSKPAW